jgi:hypothetical protein
MIETTEIFKSPQFALLTLQHASNRWPKKYRKFNNAVLGLLHPGSYVKVIATSPMSVGDVVTEEEIWLLIKQLSPNKSKKGKHIGEVRTRTGRSQYHGLELGMLIYFTKPNVIDVQVNLVGLS